MQEAFLFNYTLLGCAVIAGIMAVRLYRRIRRRSAVDQMVTRIAATGPSWSIFRHSDNSVTLYNTRLKLTVDIVQEKH